MNDQTAYEYMHLVLRQEAKKVGASAGRGSSRFTCWEAIAVGPDGATENLARVEDGTEIRHWSWGHPFSEVSQYLTRYGSQGWSLVTEGELNYPGPTDRHTTRVVRYVLSRPKAP